MVINYKVSTPALIQVMRGGKFCERILLNSGAFSDGIRQQLLSDFLLKFTQWYVRYSECIALMYKLYITQWCAFCDPHRRINSKLSHKTRDSQRDVSLFPFHRLNWDNEKWHCLQRSALTCIFWQKYTNPIRVIVPSDK